MFVMHHSFAFQHALHSPASNTNYAEMKYHFFLSVKVACCVMHLNDVVCFRSCTACFIHLALAKAWTFWRLALVRE